LHRLDRKVNSTTTGMAEHDDESRAKFFHRQFDTAHQGGRDDIAGDPNDEEIAQANVKNDLDRHTGIGTAQNDRKRRLAIEVLIEPGMALAGVGTPVTVDKSGIAFPQFIQCFRGADRLILHSVVPLFHKRLDVHDEFLFCTVKRSIQRTGRVIIKSGAQPHRFPSQTSGTSRMSCTFPQGAARLKFGHPVRAPGLVKKNKPQQRRKSGLAG